MRSGASVCQERADSWVPRGARTGGWVMTSPRVRAKGCGDQAAAGDETVGGFDVGGEEPVGAGPGHVLAQHGDRGSGRRPGNQRRAQFDAAGSGHDLDGQHPGEPVDGRAELAGRVPPHRHVVLLHRAGRDGVDARRHSQPLQRRADAGLGVLGDHQAGVDAGVVGEEGRQAAVAGDVEEAVGAPLADAGEVGDADGEEVEDVRHRCAVEVAVRLHPSVVEHGRVVDGRRQFPLGDQRGVADGVTDAAVHLRRAAQGVGVLHHAVADPVAGQDRGAGEEPRAGGTQTWPARGGDAAPSGRPRRCGRCRAGPPRSSQRPGRRRRAAASRSASASTSMPSMPSVPLIRARPSFSASTTGVAGRGRRAPLPWDARGRRRHGAFADERERAVGQRCEVAGAAEAAVLVHHRHQPGVQQGCVGRDGGGTDAAVAAGEGGEAQQHHRAHHLVLDAGTVARGVRADQALLQPARGRRRGCCGLPAPRSRWTPRTPRRRRRRGRRCGRGLRRPQPRPPASARRGRLRGPRRPHRTG